MFNIQSGFTYRTVPDYAEESVKLSLQNDNWYRNAASQPGFWVKPFPVKSTFYVCDLLVKNKSVKKEPAENDSPSSAKRTCTSMKVNCTSKLNKYFLTDNSISVDYVWKHANHDPYDVKDIVQSRLPAEVKRWIEEHVDDALDNSIDNDNSSSAALCCEEYVEDTEKYLSMYNSIVKRKLNEVKGDVENLDQLLSKVKRDCFSSLSGIGVSSQALPSKQSQNT